MKMYQATRAGWRSKLRLSLGVSLGLGLQAVGMAAPAWALPGQTVDEVAAWIQAHPTLQPASGERLQVRKSDTPAHRFTFEALPFLPGRGNAEDGNLIRVEQLSFFDRTIDVSPSRLQEALRVIYGDDIYQDYQQARVVYQYPDSANPNAAQESETPLQASLRGEVRQGQRYAYWLETVPTASGIAYNGRISVLLNEDVAGLVSVLQRR